MYVTYIQQNIQRTESPGCSGYSGVPGVPGFSTCMPNISVYRYNMQINTLRDFIQTNPKGKNILMKILVTNGQFRYLTVKVS